MAVSVPDGHKSSERRPPYYKLTCVWQGALPRVIVQRSTHESFMKPHGLQRLSQGLPEYLGPSQMKNGAVQHARSENEYFSSA